MMFPFGLENYASAMCEVVAGCVVAVTWFLMTGTSR